MSEARFFLCALILIASAAGLLPKSAVVSAARAADASSWDGDRRSVARLIAAAAVGEAEMRVIRAGIEIKLAPGWKTYWRYPGDAGIPPLFDFARSENVKAVTVLWPAPQRFSVDGVRLVGYAGQVILPLRIVPQDPAKPVVLRLKLDYAICEKLCMPMEAKADLILSESATSHEVALATAEARVPKSTVLGDDRAFAICARREHGPARARIVIDIAAPDMTSIDVFAEGPTPDWALPMPEPVAATAPGLRRFVLDIDGVPSGVKPEGAMLKLTAISGHDAIEVSVPLD